MKVNILNTLPTIQNTLPTMRNIGHIILNTLPTIQKILLIIQMIRTYIQNTLPTIQKILLIIRMIKAYIQFTLPVYTGRNVCGSKVLNCCNKAISLIVGAISNLLLTSMPMQAVCLNACKSLIFSNPMPPLSRKGVDSW